MYNQLTFKKGQSGFSLIEAMVALVVISVGMLGVAALYVEGLRSERTALSRTHAVALVGDIAERIRANSGAQIDYEVAATSADIDANCLMVAGCTATALAKHDKAVWLNTIEETLPDGSGTIDFDATTDPATYVITVTWKESGLGDQSYELRLQI